MKLKSKDTFILKIKDEIETDKAVEAIKTLFDFETPYQGQRLVSFILQLRGQFVRMVLGKARKPKTQTALGFYFGALLPATCMDFKGLEYDPFTSVRYVQAV